MTNPISQFRKNPIIELSIIIIACITGFNLQMNWFALHWDQDTFNTIGEFAASKSWNDSLMDLRLLASVIVTPIVIFLFRFCIVFILKKLDAFKDNIDIYLKYDFMSYIPLLLTSVGFLGININFYLIFLLFFIIQSYLIFKIYAENAQIDMNTEKVKNNRLYILFFISGFAALIYQVVWQRALFRFFGVNIESITIIVSVFMLGLGLGALLGGYLSKKLPGKLPHLFVLCEGLIGIFGFFSLHLFEFLYGLTLHSSQLSISLVIYGVLLVPTVCMGATLPLLVEYFHQTIKNVGKTVSFLYFINTLGSALASFFTVEVLFIYFGMQFSTIFASVCNLTVSFIGILFIKHYKYEVEELSVKNTSNVNEFEPKKPKWQFYLMLLLACLTGYVAMSQEVIWIRFISFATGGRANVFGILVGSVLVGIALGSIIATWICEKRKERLLASISICLILSAILYYLSIPFLAYLDTKLWIDGTLKFIYIIPGIIAFLMGITLPVISHYAVQNSSNVGFSVSWIYFANIVGSTTGPILTGFYFLDWWDLDKNILLLSILTWIIGFTLWFFNIKSYSIKNVYKPILLTITLVLFFFHTTLYDNLFEKIQLQKWYYGQDYKYQVQNRSGIISIMAEDAGDDAIFGGGLYDGRFNISLSHDRNVIERAYAFAALKPDADSILEIGLSSGSWSKVITMHNNLKSLDIVEINPGYLDIINYYPEHKTIFNDPRVNIHIDDGRRWLSRTDKKFDFILMNTTYYWRSQINNLVSIEFLQLCKSHLKDGGVLYYNTTGSADVVYTASHAFKYVTRFINFVAASDSPFTENINLKRESLKLFTLDGKTVYNPSDTLTYKSMENIVSQPFHENIRDKTLLELHRNLITDDNLASEFKTDSHFYDTRRAWYKIFIN